MAYRAFIGTIPGSWNYCIRIQEPGTELICAHTGEVFNVRTGVRVMETIERGGHAVRFLHCTRTDAEKIIEKLREEWTKSG